MKRVRDWIIAIGIATLITSILIFTGAYLLIATKHKTFFNPWGG